MRALLLGAAAVALSIAIGLALGSRDPLALVLVLVAIGAVAGALRVREDGGGLERAVAAVLGCGAVAGLLHGLLRSPGWHGDHAAIPAYRPTLVVAAVIAAGHLWPREPALLVRLRPLLLATAWLALVGILFRAYPTPTIDVWDIQQAGAQGLLRGENPYTLAYPNRYGPGTKVLAKEVLSADGSSILAYPYPPLTVIAGAPAAALGDVRYLHVALTLLSAAGIWLLGRRSRVAELAATLLLFQPLGVFLVEQAWTEPMVLASLVGLALAAGAPRAWAWSGLAAGLALGSKQYTPLLLLPFLPLLAPRDRIRSISVAAAVGLAVHLPFLFWDPGALWRGVIEFHLSQPFRRDSLSLAAAVFASTGQKLPGWSGFLAAALVVAGCWRRIRSPVEALAVAALAWLVLLLLAKQAFANYYGLAIGLLCAAAAVSCRGERAARPAGTAGAAALLDREGAGL